MGTSTYAGLVSPAVLEYLRSLGITAVELMPIHQFVDDKTLMDRGLANYWGYNSIGFFAPDARYTSDGRLGQQVNEFKTTVKLLQSNAPGRISERRILRQIGAFPSEGARRRMG